MRKLFLPLPALFCTQECRNSKIPNLMRLGIFMFMVEARGFEPLSEGNATQASTGVVTVLSSPGRAPRNRLSPKASLIVFFRQPQAEAELRSPLG